MKRFGIEQKSNQDQTEIEFVVTNDDGVPSLELPRRFVCEALADAAWLAWTLNNLATDAAPSIEE